MRRSLQVGFLALTVGAVFVVRGDAERWCPFGGVETLYTYLTEGNMVCSLGVSNLYLLGGVIVMTLLLRRAFCGYVCPIGAVSEFVQKAAARMAIRPRAVPSWADTVLAPVRYALLGLILYFTYRTAELVLRGYDPCYALISRHGTDITAWAYVISAGVLVTSAVILLPFCRFLCPLAAILDPFSKLGLTRVRRHEASCVQCGECSVRCPMGIPVDRVQVVRHARCLACFECVDACQNTVREHRTQSREHETAPFRWRRAYARRSDSNPPALTWGPPPAVGRAWSKRALAAILALTIVAPVTAAYVLPLPAFVRQRGTVPPATAVIDMKLHNLTCRGNCNLLMYFLERDDRYALPGYLRVEAWPAPDAARVRVTCAAAVGDERAVKRAATEPYFDTVESVWRFSPFEIEGFDPLTRE